MLLTLGNHLKKKADYLRSRQTETKTSLLTQVARSPLLTCYLLLAHPVVHLLGVAVKELQVHALLILLPAQLPQLQQGCSLLRENGQLEGGAHRGWGVVGGEGRGDGGGAAGMGRQVSPDALHSEEENHIHCMCQASHNKSHEPWAACMLCWT